MGVKLGADTIEFDIHESRDGHLVVMHDPEVARTTDGHGRIKDMALAEIKRLDAGVWFSDRFRGERVPTLPEVLDWAHGRTPVIIEIKGDSQPAIGIERKLVNALRDHSMVSDAMIISFHHPALRCVRELEPRLVTAISYVGQLVDTVGAVNAAKADGALARWSFWTPELVNQVRAAGIAALTWYPEAYSPEGMALLAGLGLDTVLIDYPGELRRYLDQAAADVPQGGEGWRV